MSAKTTFQGSEQLAEIEKLKITTFKDEDYKDQDKEFSVMYNPNTYSLDYKLEMDKKDAAGSTGNVEFKMSSPKVIKFDFLFDATGASQPENSNVADQLAKDGHTNGVITDLVNAMFDIKGDEHRPRHLVINWGELLFRGVLESATVTHKMFNSRGLPLRSVVSCGFLEHESFKQQAAAQKKESPDLTKFKQVKQEDKVGIISQDSYRTPDYYLEIARVNKLSNFRSLKNGSSLRLPPVDKK